MAVYLLIDNNTIINAIVAEPGTDIEKETGYKFIESYDGGPWIGWFLNDDNIWVAPN